MGDLRKENFTSITQYDEDGNKVSWPDYGGVKAHSLYFAFTNGCCATWRDEPRPGGFCDLGLPDYRAAPVSGKSAIDITHSRIGALDPSRPVVLLT